MTNKHILGVLIWILALLTGVTSAQSELALSSVNPTTITSGQKSTLTVTGAGFIAETDIQIDGVDDIVVNVNNDTTLTVALPASMAAGTYALSAQNPDDDTTMLNNAFTVVDPLPTETPTQTPTATPTATKPPRPTATPTLIPMAITRSEPQQVDNGQANTLSVLGTGFETGATVRLVGYGLLETTVLHGNAMTAIIPMGLPTGTYSVEVTDSSGRLVQSPNRLVVNPVPLPTQTPQPLPTPIIVAQLPALSVSNFIATPSTITAGQSTQLTFTVQNRGNQIARTITVTLGSGSQFVVSGGQSSITIPDLVAGGIYNATMTVTAIQGIPAGAVTIPLKLSYQTLTGETLTADAELSVTVTPSVNQSQIVIDGYTIDPILPEPGKPVIVRLTVVNRGDTIASQVALRVSGGDAILLPNGQGDTFIVGDVAVNERLPLQMPLIVNSSAKNGVQIQPITISYVQNGEAKEITSAITVNIATVDKPQPFLLLASYETGHETLTPGIRFTLDISLQNVGQESADGVTVTFGTVQSSSDGGNDPNNPDGGGSQSSTPSTTFAPLGTAGLAFIGDIAVDSAVQVSQEFIVAGDVTSGIYSLPITLQYRLPDATSKQETRNLSLVVIAPPRLRINPPNPLPEFLNAGEMMPIMLELANLGKTRIDLTEATVTAENGEIIEGATIQLEPLAVDDDTSLTALVMPLEEGTLTVNIALAYINDLGQTETIDLSYSAEVMPMPEIIEEPYIPEEPTPTPEPEVDWFGKFVMAFMGLGS